MPAQPAKKRLTGVWTVLAALLASCAHAPSAPRTPALEAIEYRFVIDAALSTIEVRVCFRGQPPAELVSGMSSGAAYLRRAWLESEHGPREVALVGQRIQLGRLESGSCVGYAIDVTRAAERSAAIGVERRGRALVLNLALLLWRPAHWEGVRELSAQFLLPKGMRVSLPWPLAGDRYVLDDSAFAFYAFGVFGDFELEHIEASGTNVEVAILDGLPSTTRAHVVPWLQRAVNAAALAFGRFPRSRAQVVVIPSGASAQPVRFGVMNRGGGASAAMLLPLDAELEPLLHDWVAVHEFCHLLHPFVRHEDAWFAEGIATYYQEVLRVRAGMAPEADAWQRLYQGSLLGHSATHSLEYESAQMLSNFSFKTVYWAGAAFALLSDVELRRRSHGKQTLDDVLQKLASRASERGQPLNVREVLARMDHIAGAPILMNLFSRVVVSEQHPNLTALYERLGLALEAGGVRIDESAPDAWIRAAIMRTAVPLR